MKELFCERCGVAMEPRRVEFSYMGYDFATELPCCSKCGQVFVPEEFAKGRMSEVEMQLEDK